MILLLIACASPPPEPDPGLESRRLWATEVYDCTPYVESADEFAYCFMLQAERWTRDEALRRCPVAGELETDCKRLWVEGMLGRGAGTADELLDFCGDDGECSLNVLDNRADPELRTQLARCSRAGRYGPDCAGHAGQRWVATGPSEDDLLALQQAQLPFGDKLHFWAGVAVHCGIPGSCDASPDQWRVQCTRGQQWASEQGCPDSESRSGKMRP